MAGIVAFMVKKTVVPNIQWNTIEDDAKWQDGEEGATNVWDGGNSRWTQTWHDNGEAPGDINSFLDVKGGSSWATDFRTDTQAVNGEVRITMAAGTVDPTTDANNSGEGGSPIGIKLHIGGDEEIASYVGGYVWRITDINLDPADITHFTFFSSSPMPVGVCYITNIEFYYDLNDAQPGGDWGSGS